MSTIRVRYNRANLSSAIEAARRLYAQTPTPRYIVATVFGLTITTDKPVFPQDFVLVTDKITAYSFDHNTRTWQIAEGH